MSADIDIIEEYGKCVDLFIRRNTITLQMNEDYEKYLSFHFDMTNVSHRQALKTLVECLQQQLDIYGDNNDQ